MEENRSANCSLYLCDETGLTIPTLTEPVYSKAKGRSKKSEKRNSKTESEVNSQEEDRLGQDENKDPKNNKLDNSVRNNKTESTSRTESKKNKKNRREREKDVDRTGSTEMEKVSGLNQKKIGENEILNKGRASTALGKRRKGDKESGINSGTGKSGFL